MGHSPGRHARHVKCLLPIAASDVAERALCPACGRMTAVTVCKCGASMVEAWSRHFSCGAIAALRRHHCNDRLRQHRSPWRRLQICASASAFVSTSTSVQWCLGQIFPRELSLAPKDLVERAARICKRLVLCPMCGRVASRNCANMAAVWPRRSVANRLADTAKKAEPSCGRLLGVAWRGRPWRGCGVAWHGVARVRRGVAWRGAGAARHGVARVRRGGEPPA